MTPEEKPATPAPKKDRPHLMSYLVLLFSAAFLLLAMSYFMQQRRSDQQVIDGLQQQNMSAMQTTQNIFERNKALLEENEGLKEQLSVLEEQAEAAAAQQIEQEKTVLALDYLWRIEREYFQGHYASARNLIQAFEQAGLGGYLPEEPISDPDYRTPAEQYKSIYNLLF